MLLQNTIVSLRALEPEDLDLLYAWENNPDIWKVSSTMAPFSRYTLSNYIEEAAERDIFSTRQLRLVIDDAETLDSVGFVDLFDFDPIDQRASVGISINEPKNRQHGYAKNALLLMEEYARKIIGMHQVFARVDSDNQASLALFDSCGYERCGYLKQWHRNEDGWHDQIEFQKLFD